MPSIIPQLLATDSSHRRAKSLPSESRCSVTSRQAGGTARRRDGPRRRQPRSTGMGPASASPGAQGWAPPAPAQESRDGPRRCRPRSPQLGQPCALAQCLHRPQPLPTCRIILHFPGICTRCHNRFREDAFQAPNNLWETRLPIMQTFIQVVPPVSPPLFPVVALVILDALEVELCLVPGFGDACPQAGGYRVVQRGYELLNIESLNIESMILITSGN